MRRLSSAVVVVLAATLGTPAAARGQGQAAVSGVAFGGVGGFTGVSEGVFHVGGGVQAVGRTGIGALTEIGYVSIVGDPGEGIGLLAVNAIYQFGSRRGESGASPFVTGGYALAFQSGSLNLWNAGVGVDWWIGRAVGVRTEVRTHFAIRDGDLPQFWQARAGLVWR